MVPPPAERGKRTVKATLKQIAEETGLSISTVSRVVTGRGYVSEETSALVNAAIKKFDYTKRERRAVSLYDNDDLVMILIGGIRSSLASENVELLIQELEKKQKRPFVAITSFSPERERSYLRFAAENHFFGVIALTIQEEAETLALLRNFPCPITMLERYLPSMEMDYLRPDHYKMGFSGAEYLIEHGHKRIGFIGGSINSTTTQDKKMGFEDCMHAYGLEIRPEWVIHVDRLIYENGRPIAEQLLQMPERPTAILCSNDISVSILDELLAQGVRVPEDMSIFTCEDSSLAAHCQIPLTCMRTDYRRMSVDAVKTLFRRQRQPNSPRRMLVYNPILVERNSVAPPTE